MALKINNETKVGILAAIATVLLILGFNFLEGDKIFNTSFELKAYYKDVDGLAEGNPVILNGLRVGQVKDIEFDNQTGSIQVIFGLDKGISVPQNTIASISNADLLGSKAIKLIRGDDPNMATNGAVLEGQRELSLPETVMKEILPLKDTLALLMGEVERLMIWTNSVMDESMGNKLEIMADNFVITSKNFSSASGRIDTLMGSAQTALNRTNSIIKNVQGQNETISRIIANTGTFSDSLAASSHDIRTIMARTKSAMASLDTVLNGVRNGEGTLGALVSDRSLYNKLDSIANSADSLLNVFIKDPKIYMDHRIHFGPGKRGNEGTKEDAREKAGQSSRSKLPKH